uniref:Secreted protein n=1 Tax=Anopheles quadriannulatus TaxID=34691 RepID=A0A182XTE1_ANOQN
MQLRYLLLHNVLQLVHAQAELRHRGFEHVAHTILLHNLHQHGKRFLFRHLHQQQPNDETGPLTVANLPVVQRVRLHHVEQCLLAEPVLLLEEVMLRVGAGNVPPDHLLARTGRLDVLGVLLLVCVGRTAQQLPDDRPEVVRYALAHQLLHRRALALLARLPVGDDAGPGRPHILLPDRGGARVKADLARVGAFAAVGRALERVQTLRVALDQLVGGLQFG